MKYIAIFHANLNYAYLTPDKYEFVIRESYELIFDTMKENFPNTKYVFEASGYTIEQMAIITPDVIEKLKRASIYVMPSLREGFGITFLEAMACGTPVIGGNVGGIKELIKDGENGFLVNSGDCKDLMNKISIILDNDLIREKFINNGFETVRNFSVKNMVDKTLKVYADIF